MIDSKLRWGIIGPGKIAEAFAGGLAHSQRGTLVAIGVRDPAGSDYAARFPNARIVHGYASLLADPEVEAVYIATPHPYHAEWAIKAAAAGKHVLCEKPLGLTAFEAEAIMRAASKAGTFLGEALMYRLHPQTSRLIDIIRSGAIGDIRLIRSSFGFAMPPGTPPDHRLYANDLAGGGILDVGGYPVSMARLLAGVAAGQPFLEPDRVHGVAQLGATGVDEWASLVLGFPNGIIAELSCSVSLAQENVLRVYGTRGYLEVPDFWFATGKEGGSSTITIHRPAGDTETITIEESGWLYAFEADAAADAIRAGRQEFSWPGANWADTLGTLRILDKWRAAVDLEFAIETPARRVHTIAGSPLSRTGTAIPKRSLPKLTKPASILTLGFEDFRTFSSGAIMLDAFFEAGGNLFDTAFVYGQGYTESLFGHWHRSRGIREQCVLIGKGAHTPYCRPEFISSQLDRSLERLQTDYLDIYFMHRDDPQIPVDEFVDAINVEIGTGRIRGIFGGSNWSRERMDAAIAYAQRTGKTAPSALSNNFSLAEMIEPVWDGCVSCSDDAWKAWLQSHQFANFAWSSQGRGFFTDRAGRGKTDNAEVVRTWYSDKNFQRRDRAIELAQRLGKKPIHIALAYVLAQPFPSIPLIGPRTLTELDDSLAALDIHLSAQDLRWLESGVVTSG